MGKQQITTGKGFQTVNVTTVWEKINGLDSQLAEKAPWVSLGLYPRLAPEVNDSPRIQRANDYLVGRGGGILFAPIGTYTMTYTGANANTGYKRSVEIGSNVTVIGEHRSLTIFDGTTVTETDCDVFLADHKDNISFLHLTVKNKYGSGIRFNSCSNVLVDDCNVLITQQNNINNAGIVGSRNYDSRGGNLSNITIKNSFILAAHLGFLIAANQNKYYENVTVENVIVDMANAINFAAPSGGEGIKIDYYTRNFNIKSCFVLSGKRSCITVEEGCTDGHIKDNTLYGTTYAQLSACVRLFGGQTDVPIERIKIESNIMNGGNYGVYSEKAGMAINITVKKNTIQGQANEGIWGYFDKSSIKDNDIYNTVNESIHLYESGGTTVSNNKTWLSKGITVEKCSVNTKVKNNEIEDGILRIYRTGDILIDGNDFINPSSSFTTAGVIFIYTTGSSEARSGIKIKRNTVKGTVNVPFGVAVYNNISDVQIDDDNELKSQYVNVWNSGATNIINKAINIGQMATAPSSGSYIIGEYAENSSPTPSGYRGWVATASGTFGTLTSVTGTVTSTNIKELTLNDVSGVQIGQFITIVGVSGVKRITSVDSVNKKILIDVGASAVVTNASIQFSAPVFKGYGAISA